MTLISLEEQDAPTPPYWITPPEPVEEIVVPDGIPHPLADTDTSGTGTGEGSETPAPTETPTPEA